MKLLKDLLYDVRIEEVLGTTHIAVENISTDSRYCKTMGLFVAIKGSQVDGHEYIAQALANGATTIVCETLPEVAKNVEATTFVKVKNSSEALGHIASAYYDHPSSELKIIAVTGTNGKTTIVSLLHKLFRIMDRKAGMVGTVENKINDKIKPSTHTTPDAISMQQLFREMLDEGCKFCFIEASSHAIDQNRLAGTKLSAAVFTNITHDHLDYHINFDNYFVAKKKLFDKLQANAFALLNADDEYFEDMGRDCKAEKITFGLNAFADEKARIIENQLQGLQLHINGQELYSRLVGSFNASNLLAVYCVTTKLGFDPLETLTSMSLLTPPAGRFELVESASRITGIVDYAHTPDALENVLKTISAIRTGDEKVITVIGCGGDRDKSKRPLMASVAAANSDQVFLTSDNPRSEDPNSIISDMKSGLDPISQRTCLAITNRDEAIRAATAFANEGDIILVAGKGHETYQEIKGIKHDFDDRLILREALESR